MIGRLAWTPAVAAALALTAAPAHAITRQQATTTALRALAPKRLGANVVVFGLPRVLGARQNVIEADGRGRKRSFKPRARRAWLFWADQDYNAFFEHPSRLVLVDDRTGRVVARRTLRWYPLVDGRLPAFLTPRGYWSARYVVYDGRASRATGRAAPRAAPRALALPPGAFADDCAVFLGDRGPDARFHNDFTQLGTALNRMGVEVHLTPPKADNTSPGVKDFADEVTAVAKRARCKDVLLFIGGHGEEHGEPGVEIRSTLKDGNDQKEPLRPDDLARILDGHPGTTFKLKINSCFSARFVGPLQSHIPKPGEAPGPGRNLLVMEVSSSATEESRFNGLYWDPESKKPVSPKGAKPGVDLKNDTTNPGNLTPGQGVSEFVWSNIAGWTAFAGSAAEIANAQGLGGSLLVHMMVRGFELGKDQDFARKIGNTHPELHSSVANTGPKPAADQPPPSEESPPPPPPPEPAPAPVLKRIAAVFDQSRFTTTYTEEASGQGLTYTWSVSIPDDKRCAEGFKPNFPNVDQAEWNHKDAAQGGTCNHDGGHNGPRGHPGTVTVVVGNADWTCTATYEGTEGDNGDPAGQGTQPSPCVRR